MVYMYTWPLLGGHILLSVINRCATCTRGAVFDSISSSRTSRSTTWRSLVREERCDAGNTGINRAISRVVRRIRSESGGGLFAPPRVSVQFAARANQREISTRISPECARPSRFTRAIGRFIFVLIIPVFRAIIIRPRAAAPRGKCTAPPGYRTFLLPDTRKVYEEGLRCGTLCRNYYE